MEWVAIPFSSRSSLPRDRTFVSCIGRWISLPQSHQGIPHVAHAVIVNSSNVSCAFGVIVDNDSRAVLLWTTLGVPFTETPPLDFILKTETVSSCSFQLVPENELLSPRGLYLRSTTHVLGTC